MEFNKRKKLLLLLRVFSLLSKRKSYSTRQRMYQVHPLYRARKLHGEYFTLMHRLEMFPMKFYEYFRMNKEQFYFILETIHDDIKPKNNLFRSSEDYISSKEKLCLTLRFLATGSSFVDLSFRFLMGKTTVRSCKIETISAINFRLKKGFMPTAQSPKDWQNIAEGFLKNWNFPNCLGAVDGKHVRMFAPRNSGSFNFNYKKCFSVILMAVVDANYKFIMVSIVAHGSNADSAVFSSCRFGRLWINNPVELKVPADTPLPGKTEPQPYVLVGDEAFGLRYNMLTPYPGSGLSIKQRIYNYRHSRARRIVESTFGILAHTWRILLKPLEIQPIVAKPLILCCCILHNYIQNQKSNESNHDTNDSFLSQTLFEQRTRMQEPASNAVIIRNEFADWMINEGNVDFQYYKI